ncbi:MAG: carboxymuconolactone decarboxylase family protein [Deltaproteobacteria bacterium]|nr:carboxymuconolactone decarboxylase family protein [Deltaproteobacteria bacterium]
MSALLNTRERELVAIGAALASNCVPCIEYHIQAARKVGLSDAEIEEAIEYADKIRRVPADKVMDAARCQLGKPDDEPKTAPSPCCTAAAETKTCC